jgi:hypothetical protein
MKARGSRAQVMHGTAKRTSGGLTKKQLKYNKQGKIVSKRMSARAKKDKRLVKAGYKTKKGTFGSFKNGKRVSGRRSRRRSRRKSRRRQRGGGKDGAASADNSSKKSTPKKTASKKPDLPLGPPPPSPANAAEHFNKQRERERQAVAAARSRPAAPPMPLLPHDHGTAHNYAKLYGAKPPTGGRGTLPYTQLPAPPRAGKLAAPTPSATWEIYGAKSPTGDRGTLPYTPLPAPPRAGKLAAPTPSAAAAAAAKRAGVAPPPSPPRTRQERDQLMARIAAAFGPAASTSAANYRMEQ